MIEMDNFSIGNLPFIAFDERKELPACSAVYFALSPTNDVLYIGQASHLNVRWITHHRTTHLKHLECTSIAWLECKKAELRTIERLMIDKFKPPLNNAILHRPTRTEKKVTISITIPERVRNEIDQLVKQPDSPFASRSHAFVYIFYEWYQSQKETI